jgi:hypothetical protein
VLVECRPSLRYVSWLCDTLNHISGPFGSRVDLDQHGALVLRPD